MASQARKTRRAGERASRGKKAPDTSPNGGAPEGKEEGPPPVEAPPEQPTNGVFIAITRDEAQTGIQNTGIFPQGDVRVTEVPTIVEMALKNFRKQVGLDD